MKTSLLIVKKTSLHEKPDMIIIKFIKLTEQFIKLSHR